MEKSARFIVIPLVCFLYYYLLLLESDTMLPRRSEQTNTKFIITNTSKNQYPVISPLMKSGTGESDENKFAIGLFSLLAGGSQISIGPALITFISVVVVEWTFVVVLCARSVVVIIILLLLPVLLLILLCFLLAVGAFAISLLVEV